MASRRGYICRIFLLVLKYILLSEFRERVIDSRGEILKQLHSSFFLQGLPLTLKFSHRSFRKDAYVFANGGYNFVNCTSIFVYSLSPFATGASYFLNGACTCLACLFISAASDVMNSLLFL